MNGTTIVSKGCINDYTKSTRERKGCPCKQWDWAQSRNQEESSSSQSCWPSLGGLDTSRLAKKYELFRPSLIHYVLVLNLYDTKARFVDL